VLRLTAIVPATNRPATLERCVAAIRAAEEAPEELIVVEESERPGPAAARNEGARRAAGDVLVFVDADVVVHGDAFRRIRQAFASDGLVAVFGCYDDEPAEPDAVSGFRNLLHHHVHASSAGPAETFWAGLGAVRRDAFLAAGGFDEERYREASIEDIELGTRLASAGASIVLDPAVQGQHLKRWTLAEMVRTDLFRRGIPWVELLLEGGGSTVLNLGWRHRLSALAALTVAGGVVTRRPLVAGAGLAALVGLNAELYTLLARKRGPGQAAVGVGLHVVHHLTAIAAVPAGLAAHLLRD
jgi:hypothetical protein